MMNMKVLVVDDDVDAAESLGELLADHGFDARVACGGEAALDLIESFTPDCALLDLTMPGIDGFEVARRMREHPRSRDAWILALTARGDDDGRRRSQGAGFDMHIVKPVAVDDLESVLWALTAVPKETDFNPGRHPRKAPKLVQVFGVRDHHDSGGGERLMELALSFPTLASCPLHAWDAGAFDDWAAEACFDPPARHAARFVLSLWNSDWPWKTGRFDATSAVAAWDRAHRVILVAWTLEPWWP